MKYYQQICLTPCRIFWLWTDPFWHSNTSQDELLILYIQQKTSCGPSRRAWYSVSSNSSPQSCSFFWPPSLEYDCYYPRLSFYMQWSGIWSGLHVLLMDYKVVVLDDRSLLLLGRRIVDLLAVGCLVMVYRLACKALQDGKSRLTITWLNVMHWNWNILFLRGVGRK